GCRHPVGAGRHAVVECRYASTGNIVFGDLRRARGDADDGVDREGEEHEQIAENLVRNADLLEDGKQKDETDETAGISAIHPAELLIKGVGARSSLSCHDAILPQSSSA